MTRRFTLIAILLCAPATGIPADEQTCNFDEQAMLELDFDTFDQTFGSGWRAVAENDGCALAAADLIRAYIELHDPGERIIVFHEAQMRAKGGETERAISLFRETRDEEGVNSAFGWNEYVDATIAFLEKDKKSLIEARSKLLAIPKPSNFNAVDRQGNPVEIAWPPNLNVVDGFLECFEKSYDEAYGQCSQGKQKTGDSQ